MNCSFPPKSKRRRKFVSTDESNSRLGVRWVDVLGSPHGPGWRIMEFIFLDYPEPWCKHVLTVSRAAYKKRTEHYRRRLLQLSGLDPVTFDWLTDRAVIAGGAVVYALNEFVPRHLVTTIDVWVLGDDHQHVRQISDRLRKLDSNRKAMRCPKVQLLPRGTVLEQNFPMRPRQYGEPPLFPIDLFRAQASSSLSLVKTFESDYLQCYFYQGWFGGTAQAQEAHRTRTATVKYDVFTRAFGSWIPPLGDSWAQDQHRRLAAESFLDDILLKQFILHVEPRKLR